MAESATSEEIAQTVDAMHDAIVAAWHREEMRYSSLVEARTTTQWGMELGPDRRLTFHEWHLNAYRPFDAPFDDYANREKTWSLPLRVDLPDKRHGYFRLIVSKYERRLENCYPGNNEKLSEAGLLHLLDVSAPEEVFDCIQDATISGRATKISVNRMVVSALPIGNRWPNLHTEETTIEGRTIVQANFLRLYEAAGGVRHLEFEGILTKDDESATLLMHKYGDTRQGVEITTLSPVRLEQIGRFTLQTLDIAYGHACFRYDDIKRTYREEVTGLDGQPSKYADFGYDYGRDTRWLPT